jgi:hypothetical protein
MISALTGVSRYFLDLGFYPSQVELGSDLQHQRLRWSIFAYGLLVLGLFAQQCVNLTSRPIRLSLTDLHWSVFGASAIVGVALFPPFMSWFNKRLREGPSWEHLLWAFSFGFFVNLSSNLIWKHFFFR